MENIALPSQNAQRKKIFEKTEDVISRMRWKAHFFLSGNSYGNASNAFGLKSRKTPPTMSEIKPFENDLFNLIEKLQFRTINDQFQSSLANDLKRINSSPNVLILANKTRNIYETTAETYNKLLADNVTKSYKIGNESTIDINSELKTIATDLSISDRIESMTKREAFISLKDNEENFQNHPTCWLINPAKCELGKISKIILDQIKTTIRSTINVNQWRSSRSVITWFKSIDEKKRHIPNV